MPAILPSRRYTALFELAIWSILIVYAIYHGWQIALNAVDVPRADEWNIIDDMPRSLTWEWLFQAHGQHRIVPSKLETWLLYRVDGWNIAHQQIVNFLLFCSLLPLFHLLNRALSGDRFWLLPAFLFFPLTPIAHDNHAWAFQSCIHFVLLFTVAAAYLGLARFDEATRKPAVMALFVLSILAALYSLSSAAGAVAAMTVAFAALLIMRFGLSFRSALGWLGVAAILIGAYVWRAGLVAPQHRAPLADYAGFFLNLVSLGHGYTTTLSLWPGMIVLALYAVPSIVLLLDPRTRASNAVIATMTLGAALLAGLAVIAIGRAGDEPRGLAPAKYSRYSELSVPLIPVIAMLLWQSLAFRKGLRVALMALYFAACLAAFRDDLSFAYYAQTARARLHQLACFSPHFEGREICSEFGEMELYRKRLDRAKALGLSFSRPDQR